MALEQEIFEALFLETETALKNGDWKTAKENVEKIKKVNPNNAKALYFEFLASQKLHNESEIFSYSGLIKDDKLFQKAYELADVELKKELNEILFKNSFKVALETYSKKTKKLKKRRANLLVAIALIKVFTDDAEAQEKVTLWESELSEIEAKIAAKKRKRRKLTLITTSAIALAAGIAVLYIYVISPFLNYTIAVNKMKGKDYAAAYGRFLSLGDYKDSEDLVKDAGYNLAIDLISQEQYVSAYELLLKYGDPDTEEYKLCMYHTAVMEKSTNQCTKAIEKFEKLGDYKDSSSLLLESKYLYAKANFNNNDEKTYAYLTELKEIKYQDSANLYTDLYKWKADAWVTKVAMDDYNDYVLKNNYNSDLTVNFEEFKSDFGYTEDDLCAGGISSYYFNFDIHGGIPGGQTKIKYVINNMGFYQEKWSNNNVDASEYCWINVTARKSKGTITVKIYDENNNYIAECSIVCK